MIRETSVDVYHQIEAEGLLSKLRFQVYEVLFKYGPLTQGECWNRFFKGQQRHTIAPRFAELERLGCLKTIGERPCGFTGRISLLWDVTKQLPQKTEEKPKQLCALCGQPWPNKNKRRLHHESVSH